MQDRISENVIEIDLEELFGLVLHRWWLIVPSGILAALAAFLISTFAIAPKYESTTGIYVMNKQNGNTLTYSDAQLSSQLTKDYEELITSRYVLEQVISQCSLNEEYEGLRGRVTVKNATDTRIIYITVKDNSPEKAQTIANSIRKVASGHIKEVTNVEAVNVVDEANLPVSPSEPSVRHWTEIGAFAGLFGSALIIVVLYLLDDTIKTSDDVEKYLEWSTLSVIPVFEESSAKKTVTKKLGAKHAGFRDKKDRA